MDVTRRLFITSLLVLGSQGRAGVAAFSIAPGAASLCAKRGVDVHSPLRRDGCPVTPMQLQKRAALREGRRRGATSLGMLLGQNAAYSPKKVLPLITGGNLIVANNGWFLEGVEGGDELFGDQAIPLELDDGQTAWILYRNGAVVLTVTEDELDALDPIEGGAAASLADPIGIARSLGGETSAGTFLLQLTAAVVSLFGGGEKPAVDRGAGFRFLDGLVGNFGRNDKCVSSRPPIATPSLSWSACVQPSCSSSNGL